jgi:hypothetical protein
VFQRLENDQHEDVFFIMRYAHPRYQRYILYRVLVLTLCTTYGLFFFLSSLCFATGLLHSHASSDAHQHRHETDHTATKLDICDFTLQMLSTSDLGPSELPLSELIVYQTTCEVWSIPPSTLRFPQPASRAPPVAFS